MSIRGHMSVSGGPSKFDLMAALFIQKPARHSVEFTTSDGLNFTAIITAVEIEDGAGERWNLKGFTRGESPGIGPYFVASFSTKTRRGRFRFIV